MLPLPVVQFQLLQCQFDFMRLFLCPIAQLNSYLVGLHVSKLWFFLLVLFKSFFLFFAVFSNKKAFSQLNAIISAEVSKKRTA